MELGMSEDAKKMQNIVLHMTQVFLICSLEYI